jgi:hypothetical protein
MHKTFPLELSRKLPKKNDFQQPLCRRLSGFETDSADSVSVGEFHPSPNAVNRANEKRQTDEPEIIPSFIPLPKLPRAKSS